MLMTHVSILCNSRHWQGQACMHNILACQCYIAHRLRSDQAAVTEAALVGWEQQQPEQCPRLTMI